LQELISPTLGLEYLSKVCEEDLTRCALDGPMPDLSAEVAGIASYRKVVSDMAQRENLTVRETYKRVLPALGHVVFKGNPVQIADQMEDWYRSQACDGFNCDMPVLPRCLKDFVDLVVPELQRRGLFRTEYAGSTLRDAMGLARPPRRILARPDLAAE
jgi:alkanesulfonate monooxygenase SsuD/methylene tetrahydromethanopterin reductase-like flavin-dependent oxidoreductase (luciferase family)